MADFCICSSGGVRPGRTFSQKGSQQQSRLLEGVRIVEACSLPAGPFSAASLAACGAQVLKLELDPLPGGKLSEAELSQQCSGAASSWWSSVPQPLALDLELPMARQVLEQTLAECDCFIHSFRPCAVLACEAACTIQADSMLAFRPFIWVTLCLALVQGEFHTETEENCTECSLSLLQSSMQRASGTLTAEEKQKKPEADMDSTPKLSLAEVDNVEFPKAGHNLLQSAFLKDVATAIRANKAQARLAESPQLLIVSLSGLQSLMGQPSLFAFQGFVEMEVRYASRLAAQFFSELARMASPRPPSAYPPQQDAQRSFTQRIERIRAGERSGGVLLIGAPLLLILLSIPEAQDAKLRFRAAQSAANSEVTKALRGQETVAFFHPYANAGGGGERVLWCCIRSVQQNHPGVACVVYTGDTDVTAAGLLETAQQRFGLTINAAGVHFVFLTKRHWVEASSWPRFTLIGQSLGSLVLGWEAICQFQPDVYIDSMGYAFTLPLFRLLGSCRVGCYVHYPTISTDMLEQVSSGVHVQGMTRMVAPCTGSDAVCNDAMVARSSILSAAKLLYYKAFATLYGMAGKSADARASRQRVQEMLTPALLNLRWSSSTLLGLAATSTLCGQCLKPGTACEKLMWEAYASADMSVHRCIPIIMMIIMLSARSRHISPRRVCFLGKAGHLPWYMDPEDFTGKLVLSLAQFRPEKNHALQLRSFAKYRQEKTGPVHGELLEKRIENVVRMSGAQGPLACHIHLVGSFPAWWAQRPCAKSVVWAGRDDGDRRRVEALRKLCGEWLGLHEEGKEGAGREWDVSFRTNVPLKEMQSLLSQADVGLHTMRDEHFGISVVEFMAAGAVVIAHNSAGPAMDIVTPLADGRRTGMLASDDADYARKLREALDETSTDDRRKIAEAAREAVRDRFSQEAFEENVAQRLIAPLRKPRQKST
ncbi:Alg11 [Symbiodinium necroappetens]|uniref:GDP-Man:Man(3)GlcNAc(2)-PP-Dol alpha-1,2-mannosyltransferase n=1 Tax=Symbiodinium necroappetens TaxID=1628268 RepID=A0A813BF31_9DINO|nr:Alg11 [Symbiodinium necroappetens]